MGYEARQCETCLEDSAVAKLSGVSAEVNVPSNTCDTHPVKPAWCGKMRCTL